MPPGGWRKRGLEMCAVFSARPLDAVEATVAAGDCADT